MGCTAANFDFRKLKVVEYTGRAGLSAGSISNGLLDDVA